MTETHKGPVPLYRCPTATHSPEQWRARGKLDPPGTHDWSKVPSVVENWKRERRANAGVDISQVNGSLSVVAWYWQCENGHRWREPANGVTASRGGMYRSKNAPRWKTLAGKYVACRQCVLDEFGLLYLRCGHSDSDLTKAQRPRLTGPGWCETCRVLGSAAQPGTAIRVAHDPPTSKQERALRKLLAERIPLASPGEANAVVVDPVSWGARHVFPDMLAPSHRIAIEYDSPGLNGDAHGEASIDAEKDSALRAAGWEVIRVRVDGLPLLGRYDVTATGPTRLAATATSEQFQRVLAERES